MIAYSQLGKNGQLGNQMFQYAALYGVGFLRGYEVCIPEEGHRLREVFKLGSAKDIVADKIMRMYKEPEFVFNANVWCLPKNIDLFGYFQSEIYFAHCEDRIREEFAFNDKIVNRANDYLQLHSIIFDKPTVSIHVRRGDYLNKSEYHANLPIQYYRKLAAGVTRSAPEQEIRFLIFSDDVEWCEENLGIDNSNIVDSGYDAVDLNIMTRCDAHIIANSSFSWWGAWLSNCNRENVFAPKEWFGPAGPDDWQTLYPQGWRVV